MRNADRIRPVTAGQPGFGPREIDPPAVAGYEPDIVTDRDRLRAEQPETDTMEAADPAPDAEDAEDAPPVVRLGAWSDRPPAADGGEGSSRR